MPRQVDQRSARSRSTQKSLHGLSFLDIKDAYDSVPRAELWRQCHSLGVDHLTLSTLRALFDHNSAQLVVAQKRSRPFPLPAGVLQGSVLSPLLYSIYLDPLSEKLRTSGPRIRLPLKPATEGINSLMYADDIALISTSSRNLARLLRLAEQDSMERGYRFSPTKCVVASQDCFRHRLYGEELKKEQSFCYLGADMNCRGINEKLHAKRRIEKAKKMANSLRRAGARFRNFQVYGLHESSIVSCFHQTRLGIRTATDALNQCQKRIICDFLGVHVNARNDIIEGISNCPSMRVRHHLLGRKRAIKKHALWANTNRRDYALLYVIEGLFGPVYDFGTTFNLDKSQEETRRDLFIIPTLASLAERSDGFLSIAVLRWLLHVPLGHGSFRTILLWILKRWRKFVGSHTCLHCHDLFADKEHIASCAGLRARLSHCEFIDFNLLTYSNESIIEHALLLVYQELILDQHGATKVLEFTVAARR
jgi:hypothetical protein